MSFLNDLFAFKRLLAKSDKTKTKELSDFPGHGRVFKGFHPLDIYRYGGSASSDTVNDRMSRPVDLRFNETAKN